MQQARLLPEDDCPARPPVTILGAGIAGLTAALALHRAGISYRVFEQAPWLSEVGAGLQLTPNATRLLHRLGVGQALSAVATEPRSIDVRRWDDGRLIGRTSLGTDCREMFGSAYYVLHRADLHRVLLNSLPSENVELGRCCTETQELHSTVRLIFEDGFRHDVETLVAADGLRSVGRTLLSHDCPAFSGYAAYRGTVPANLFPALRDEPRVRGWAGPNQHFVCYPISNGTSIAFSAVTAAPGMNHPEPVASTSHAAAADFRGWTAEVLQLFEAAEAISWWPLYDRDPITNWSTERVTLIGDAAHPMLPFRAQGANQAIEDAVTLAECFRTPDPPGPLRQYEQLRQPRTAELQLSSREVARTLHAGGGAHQEEAVSEQWALRNQAQLFGHHAENLASVAH